MCALEFESRISEKGLVLTFLLKVESIAEHTLPNFIVLLQKKLYFNTLEKKFSFKSSTYICDDITQNKKRLYIIYLWKVRC